MMPEVSIVVLSHNHWEWTEAALLSLAQTADIEYETIVLDNGSVAATRRALRSMSTSAAGRRVRLQAHWADHNLGVAAGRNAAALYSQGRYLLFLDNDTRVTTSTWLRRLRDMLDDSDLGILGPSLFNIDDPTVCQFCGGGFDERGNLVYWTEPEKMSLHGGAVIPALYCLGACMMIRRDVWQQLDGFDTTYSPMDYEDIDFCLRAKDKGAATGIAARVQLLHKGHVTTGARTFDRLRCYLVNGRRFRKRWAHMFSGPDNTPPREGPAI